MRFLFLLACLSLLWSQPSLARLYNYEDMPLGVRGFGMGKVGMAIEEDVGSLYLNPAVMSWAEGSQVSAGVSAYSRIDTRTGEFVSLFKSAADNVTRGGFLSVPTNVGGFFTKDGWHLGGAVFVPQAFENKGSVDIRDDYLADFESFSEDIWINLFASRKINERSAWGISLFYVSREIAEKFSYFDAGSGSLNIDFVEKQWASNGVVALLGYSKKETENFQWGTSVRLPAWSWGGQGRDANIDGGDSEINVNEFDVQGLPVPVRLSWGMEYRLSHRASFAADLHFYLPYKKNLKGDGDPYFNVELRAIPNLNFGYEFFFKKSLGARIGFYTNITAAENVPSEVSAIHDKVHMFGGTGAIVLAAETGEVSLGGWAQGGQGYSRSVNPASTGREPRSNYFYGILIASSYKF